MSEADKLARTLSLHLSLFFAVFRTIFLNEKAATCLPAKERNTDEGHITAPRRIPPFLFSNSFSAGAAEQPDHRASVFSTNIRTTLEGASSRTDAAESDRVTQSGILKREMDAANEAGSLRSRHAGKTEMARSAQAGFVPYG